jgi:TldD protein
MLARAPSTRIADMTSSSTSSVGSLIDRAGLDRPRLSRILGHGLEGADDGELFLEYRQSEVMAFDNGRLKQATYDTAQGFGLRAVKDEAVGYAHAS